MRTLINLLLCVLIASNGVVSGSGPSMARGRLVVMYGLRTIQDGDSDSSDSLDEVLSFSYSMETRVDCRKIKSSQAATRRTLSMMLNV